MANYVPGDFYRICDRTGFKVRASETRKEWNDLIVRDASFEQRNVQDFVTGVLDEQWVDDPRPRQTEVSLGPLSTYTTANFTPGQLVLSVTLTTRMLAGDRVSLMQDNGVALFTTIQSIISATSLQLVATVTFQASSGALFTDLSALPAPDIG